MELLAVLVSRRIQLLQVAVSLKEKKSAVDDPLQVGITHQQMSQISLPTGVANEFVLETLVD